VYLSYLDSVKYFQPEVQAGPSQGNISLRTFVYHELLLAYLQFVRELGYETMLIWACPPLQVGLASPSGRQG
jgi:E1A/CREB-binding protein